MQPYIAHIREGGAVQTVLEHLQGTRDLAASFAGEFDAAAAGELAGMAHDLGKFSYEFQTHILHPERRMQVDHSTAGAQILMERAGGLTPAAFAVAGHHGGLPDGGGKMDSADQTTLWGRWRRQVPAFEAWQKELELPNEILPAFVRDKDAFTLAFYTRMLYSCLVDADFLDTERFMNPEKDRKPLGLPPAQMEERLDQRFAEFDASKSDLNQRRSQIQASCRAAAAHSPGLFTLTVPTGGGKTLSSLAFALRHACLYGKKRILYVIPYTSIIDQTAQNFSKVMGPENVLEHHASVDYDNPENATLETYRKALATENWDATLIITTAVQFFESLFANRSSKCRKLHNIANSVIIFDEAQTIPVAYLQPCVAAIAELVSHYGVTAVLCTATQPALEPLFAEYGLSAREICRDSAELYPVFRRTTIRDLGMLDQETLLQQLKERPRVLCVVNRRQTAQALYAGLEGDGNYCLTTLLYPEHRKVLLKEIRERLDTGQPCRVVSTSLIEAGVDVDFPLVYREEAGLDSLIQSAGRCNREGKDPAGESFVYQFRISASVPPMIRQNVDASRAVLRTGRDPQDPETIARYFRFLRNLKGQGGLDKQKILDAFRRGIDGCWFPFAQVAERFRLIDAPTQTVYIPEEKGAMLVESLRRGQVSRSLFRALGNYSVSIYPDHFQRLMEAGALETLDSGDSILWDLNQYNRHTGLALDPGTGYGWMI